MKFQLNRCVRHSIDQASALALRSATRELSPSHIVLMYGVLYGREPELQRRIVGKLHHIIEHLSWTPFGVPNIDNVLHRIECELSFAKHHPNLATSMEEQLLCYLVDKMELAYMVSTELKSFAPECKDRLCAALLDYLETGRLVPPNDSPCVQFAFQRLAELLSPFKKSDF